MDLLNSIETVWFPYYVESGPGVVNDMKIF